MLIGADFKPFYAAGPRQGPRRQDLAARSSGRSAAARCGAGSPTIPSSTSSTTAPAIPARGTRSSGPATTSGPRGIFARRPDTGEARWFYQLSPHDLHDYDGVNENILLDLPIEGQPRKVLLHPDRNGYVYVIDRATRRGAVRANRSSYVTTSRRASTCKTGRLKTVRDKSRRSARSCATSVPPAPGAKDWQPVGVLAAHRAALHPAPRICARTCEGLEANYIAGTPYVGANVQM